MRSTARPGRWRAALARVLPAVVVAGVLPLVAATVAAAPAAAAGPCDPGGNKIVCENSKPGTPKDQWYNTGNYGDIDGFGTATSVQPGETLPFKVRAPSTKWQVDIVRLGWYQGTGGRLITTLQPSASAPQTQPSCVSQTTTGLIDCGNWGVSASWQVPADAVSGFYIATFNRTDAPGVNTFPFVVRDESSHSQLVVQTSDQTWQAYNSWGGNNLYVGTVNSSDGRAYKVSYNRPYNNSATASWYNAETPLIRWLERNGYDVSYLSGVDVTRNPALVRNHATFISSGHDEYWNAAQRTGIEQARAAGVNLMFLSGNEMFWKTRFEPSIDGAADAYRTLVCYKETKANGQKLDPTAAWTGTWRDPRLSPPADGGRPENALTGTLYRVNGYRYDAITVPARFAADHVWRNTSIANLTGNQVSTLPAGTLGYEWDEDAANASRPDGAIDLSSTTVVMDGTGGAQVLQDYGNAYGNGPVTHSLVLYRDQASRALVFGAGTVQWAWGLDSEHLYPGLSEGGPATEDARIKQATVNLLADMGAQPATLQSGLVAATASTDTTGPTLTVTSPASGGTVPAGQPATITGTAADANGVVARVEGSVDGGTTWTPATGLGSWSFSWTPKALGQTTLLFRAVDDSANIGAVAQLPLTAGPQQCPCTVFGSSAPTVLDSGESGAIEVGMKFTPTVNGTVTGVRFHKSTANTGTHTGSVWSTAGVRLATGTFTGESASGWQTLTFATPLQVRGNTTYVVSYTAPSGHYAADGGYFASSGAGLAPLVAPANGGPAGGQGVYKYGTGFPTSSYNATNYWVDVVYDTSGGDALPPTVTSRTPANGATGSPTEATVTAVFSEALDPTSLQFTLTGGGGAVAGSTQLSDDGGTATFVPAARLAPSTTYTASVKASDGFGNAMSAPVTWTFTTGTDPCPCTLFRGTVPALQDAGDTSQVELGVKFQTSVNATVTALKFYKSAANTGTHTGTLWSSTGAVLATGTYTGESDSGWQTLTLSTPVPIQSGRTYVVSYNAPVGHYAATSGYFTSTGAGTAPLTAPSSAAANGQGVYKYGTGFPTGSYNGTNYWVDVVVTTAGADTTPPTVTATTPAADATGAAVSGSVTATFSEPVDPATVTFGVVPSGGTAVAGAVTVAADGRSATFNPTSDLAAATAHTASVRATDLLGNAMPAAYTWSFTTASGGPSCPCSVFRASDVPASSATDSPLELGMKWQTSAGGWVTGVRFYKAAGDTGTHTGSLWSAAGVRLATGTYANETASGWQTLNFSSPVPVTAATTYVVSYYTPAGKFRYSSGFFAAAKVSGPLTGLANGASGPNGVFKYATGGGFPTGNGNGSNYWADVVFTNVAP